MFDAKAIFYKPKASKKERGRELMQVSFLLLAQSTFQLLTNLREWLLSMVLTAFSIIVVTLKWGSFDCSSMPIPIYFMKTLHC